jgi:hypothetical protein
MSDHKARMNRLELYKEFLRNAGRSNSSREDLKHIPGYDFGSLEKAATYFELDHTDPSHLMLLTRLLADLQFGERRPGRQRGAKIEWTGHKSDLLVFAYFDLRERHPKYSDNKIADQIRKIREFDAYDTETLRKKLIGLRQTYEMWADESEIWKAVWAD